MINIHFLRAVVFLIFYNYLKLSKKENKNIYEKIIQISLGLTFISSLLFWNNPVKYDFFHIFDAVNVIILYFLLIFYHFYFQLNISKSKISISAILLNIMTFFAFKSRIHSSKWLSDNHLYYYFLLHLFGNMAICHFLN